MNYYRTLEGWGELEIYPLPTPFTKVLLQMRSLCLWLDESTPKSIAFFSTLISFKYSACLIEALAKSTRSRSPNHETLSQTRNFTEKDLVRWIYTFLWTAPSQMREACLYCELWYIPENKEMSSAESSGQVGHEVADHIFIVSAADTRGVIKTFRPNSCS
jgi:hypothetical protein